jgi:WD40 repeat protein
MFHGLKWLLLLLTCSMGSSGCCCCCAGYEKLLRLYEVERPEADPLELPGAPAAIRAAVFVGPEDSLLVSISSDTSGLSVWDVRAGQLVRSLLTEGAVSSIDVSANCLGVWRLHLISNVCRAACFSQMLLKCCKRDMCLSVSGGGPTEHSHVMMM